MLNHMVLFEHWSYFDIITVLVTELLSVTTRHRTSVYLERSLGHLVNESIDQIFVSGFMV